MNPYKYNPNFSRNFHQILQSLALRRLQFKTQVYPHPRSPHVRNRMIHSLEVMSISNQVAKVLGLNVDLISAIAIGHDVGHPPYGHLGERFITTKTGKKFRHELFGPFLLEKIEGIDLAPEIVTGIKKHSFDVTEISTKNWIPEYAIIPWADKFSVVFSDYSDYFRVNQLKLDFPKAFSQLGKSREERLSNCIFYLIEESLAKGQIYFSESLVAKSFREARNFMYQSIYKVKNEKLNYSCLDCVWEWLTTEPELKDCDPVIIFAMLTDNEVLEISMNHMLLEKPCLEKIQHFGFIEFLPEIRKASCKNLDIFAT